MDGTPFRVFLSYSHKDENLRAGLKEHLAPLLREGAIVLWQDLEIQPGQEWEKEILEALEASDIVLLLISPSFLASDFCYVHEMNRALERHEERAARVVPVLVRPCDWKTSPFAKLQALPAGALPVTKWDDRDEAFLSVAQGLRRVVEDLRKQRASAESASKTSPTPLSDHHPPKPRNSPSKAFPGASYPLLARSFSDREKDQFRRETFEIMARYFQGAIDELGRHNAGFEGSFLRVDANRFSAVVYRNGRSAASCTIYLLDGRAIAYVPRETTESNSYSELLNVEVDDRAMYLKDTVGSIFSGDPGGKRMTQEQAAERFWKLLMSPLLAR